MPFVPALFGVLLLGACAAVQTTAVDAPVPVPIQRLASDPEKSLFEYSGVVKGGDWVIRDRRSWQQLWAIMFTASSRPPAPAVDFSRDMVVVSAIGQLSSGGTTVLIKSASKLRGRLMIHTVVRSMGMGCVVTMAFTQPVDAAIVPRHDGPVAFVNRSEIVCCECAPSRSSPVLRSYAPRILSSSSGCAARASASARVI
jgi:hypothetical protein